MSTTYAGDDHYHETARHPVNVQVTPEMSYRNRVTTFFRFILAIPHLLLVGAPMALAFSWTAQSDRGGYQWGAGGVLGAVAGVVAFIAWFAILFTGRYPAGLWSLAALYLRWRVRASAYMALLSDRYPPFGDGAYPVQLELAPQPAERNRVTVAFRIVLAIPHLIVLGLLGFAWAIVTALAWFAILFTAEYPASLYEFSVGVLRWTTRVEAYLLLLRDEYPPFSLHE